MQNLPPVPENLDFTSYFVFLEDDEVFTDPAQPVTFRPWANDVLSGVFDATGTDYQISYLPGDMISDPVNGTLVVNDGVVTYTPNAGFVGLEFLTYSSTIREALGTVAEAQVMISVGVQPDAPAYFGFVVRGLIEEEYFGSAVNAAGDFNGDGIDDVAISARYDLNSSGTQPEFSNGTGNALIVFGSDDGFARDISNDMVAPGAGIVLNGINIGDNAGTSVEGIGDFNDDGIDDLVVGARSATTSGGQGSGQSYVVFGSDRLSGGTLDLETLDGRNGFAINGAGSQSLSGASAAGAGDVNGDGLMDVIIGATGAGSDGHAYVVFGSAARFADEISVASLNGDNGFTIIGEPSARNSGYPVSGLGDVNGDGIDDVFVNGSPGTTGKAYVVFGSDQGFAATVSLASLSAGDGFALTGFPGSGSTNLFEAIAGGDVNGDGINDIIVSDRAADANGEARAGHVYVVFGSDRGFGAEFDVQTLDGSNGFVLTGGAANDAAGRAIAINGDANGDGIDDILVAATGADGSQVNTGAVYLVFGSDDGFDTSLDLASLDGTTGYAFLGIDSFDLGSAAAAFAGDINNDGIGDIVIGANTVDFAGPPDVSRAGEAYLVFGGDGLGDFDAADGVSDGQIELRRITTPDPASGGSGEDCVVDPGTGGADLIEGCPQADTIDGLGGNDTLTGRAGSDLVNGGAGNDNIDGGIGFDQLNGDGGNDELRGLDGFDTLEGGAGNDSLEGNSGNDSLSGGTGNDTLVGGLGFDDLSGDEGDDLLQGLDGFDTLSGGEGEDRLEGNNGNDSLLGDAGEDRLEGGLGSDTMSGGEGNDTLLGANGFDVLLGDAGDDLLEGNAGNDTMNGGLGDDTMRGGLGADTFQFRAGADRISDFQNNVDAIEIAASLLTETAPVAADLLNYASVDAAGNVVLDFGLGQTLTISGVTNANAILDDVALV